MKLSSRAAALLLILVAVAAGSTAPAAAATPVPAVSVSLSLADSGDLGAGAPLRAVATIANTTAADTETGTATLSVDPTPFSTRAALADWFSGRSSESLASRSVARSTVPAVTSQLTGSVSLSAPAARLPFTTPGIYAVSVRVVSGSTVLGTARSAVAWNAAGARPVPVAIAVPLTVPAGSGEFLTAAQLTQYTGPGGVLSNELSAIQGTGLAVGIDPRIIASIRVLGSTAPASALAWLDALKALPNETFPLAWADADLTAPLHAGSPAVIAPKSLAYAINPNLFTPGSNPTPSPTPTSGSDTSVVPTSASLVAWNYTMPAMGWPAEGSVESSDLPKLAAAGVSSAILTTSNVDGPDPRGLEGASSKSGSTMIAVSDDVLSGYLRQSVQSTSRTATVGPMTELTTTLALIGLQSGRSPRGVLLTLGRNWATADASVSRTVGELYARPWVSPTTLSSLFGETPNTVTLDKDAEPATRLALVSQLLAAEGRIVDFAPIAKVPSAITSSYRLQLLSLLSDEWIDAPTAWYAAGGVFLTQCDKVVSSVQLAKSSTLTAGADQISLPISISNGLDQDVTVRLSVRPTTALVTIAPEDQLQTITIPANSQRRIQVPIEALSNGTARLILTLTSSTGTQIGSIVSLKVNVQAGWETAGTLVFVALVVALFAFGVIRNIRKRRRAAAAGEDVTGE